MKFLMGLLFAVVFLGVPVVQAEENCTLEIKIAGAIGSATTDYLDRAMAKAEELECTSILTLINTPGGNLESTRIIVERILNSKIPFLCLVAPQGAHAGSAGAIILQACHINGALNATNIGAATPIAGTGQELGEDLRKKLINDTVSWLEGVTKLRGRNMEFSKQIVEDAKAVSSEEAYKIKAIDILAQDIQAFLDAANGRTVKIEDKDVIVTIGAIESYKHDSRFHLLQIFSDPQIAYLLFMGSLALLYFEFTHPGTIAPGVIGAIGLIVSLISFHKLDVWWGGLALMILGVVFLIAEIFVTSFGALGIGGIIAFVLGGIFLFDESQTAYSLPLMTILPTAIVLGGTMIGIGYMLLQTRVLRVRTGSEEMVGKTGSVTKASKNRTLAMIQGEIWTVKSADELQVGDEIKVHSMTGLVLTVEKIKK